MKSKSIKKIIKYDRHGLKVESNRRSDCRQNLRFYIFKLFLLVRIRA
ncbi:hypothetical protein HMP0721_2021 [Pseudoramibacter alactolyticus ATCC 23263]|uniref:Uncharacterized protein n=1 Tax=Pseudoramibacter alactolyticus ATCC 23263 TaxID=887929 RepID=E6MJ36_9FIRM|nr:hypothetical protein HMP0721_2021 [Pseudoramibacter alactolyticus ATCC 23263]